MSRHVIHVTAQTAIAASAAFALPAVEAVLEGLRDPEHASLALNARELHVPFQVVISVPVTASVRSGAARNEWRLRLSAASNAQLYPVFEGEIALLRAAGGSELRLEGTYEVPFGAAGRVLDQTAFHGIAQSCLQQFLREIGHRVAAISRWSRIS